MVVLALAAFASANHYWDNNTGDGNWMTLTNWSSTKGNIHTPVPSLPASGVLTYVLIPANQEVASPPAADANCTIPLGQVTATGDLKVGNYPQLDKTGVDIYVYGTLNTSGTIWLAASRNADVNNPSSLIIDGGQVDATGSVYLGARDETTLEALGNAKIYIDNGAVLNARSLGLFNCVAAPQIVGEVYLYDGTINLGIGGLTGINSSIRIDISDSGVIYLVGDKAAEVQTYVNDGHILLNGVPAPLDIEVSYDFTSDKTVVRKGDEIWKRKAKNLFPLSSAQNVPTDVVLTWTPGFASVSSDLYLGTTLDAVNYDTALPLLVGITTTFYDSTQNYELNTKYYWRVDEYDGINTWQGPIWTFTTTEGKAQNPTPANQDVNVPNNGTLQWEPGCYASSHDVYLGLNEDDVDAATTVSSQFKQTVTEASYDYSGLIRQQTYFWRVDEVNDTSNFTVKGDVWQFTVEGFNVSANVINVTPSQEDAGAGRPAVKLIDKSGLDATETLHSGSKYDMWTTKWEAQLWTSFVDSSAIPLSQAWVAFEFEKTSFLQDVKIWNFNREDGTDPAAYGLRDINIYYSAVSPASDNPEDWSVIKTTLPKAPAAPDYHYIEPPIDLGGAVCKYVVIAANEYDGHWTTSPTAPWGLSEVLFSAAYVFANDPYPADANQLEASALDGIQLQWNPGSGAASQNMYFSSDYTNILYAEDANSPAFKASLSAEVNFYDISSDNLELGGQYYWRVDTVSERGIERGPIWTFNIIDHVTIDDMERYETGDPKTYLYWDDGWFNGTGSELAYKDSIDYIETVILHSGLKAMYMTYDNAGDFVSDIEARFTGSYPMLCGSNLTQYGAAILEIWYHGDPANSQDSMYLTLDDGNTSFSVIQDADLSAAQWHSWRVPLSDFTGVNLTNVQKIHFGIGVPGRTSTSGATGTLILDDFALYAPYCRPEFTSDSDLNADCVVDYKDLKILCQDWLEKNINPKLPAIGPVASWQFDSAAGGITPEDIAGKNATMVGGSIVSDPQRGNVLELNGSNEYLTHNFVLPMQTGTITHWLKPDANDHLMCAYYEGDLGSENNGNGGTDILEVHTGLNFAGKAVGIYQDGTDPEVSYVGVNDDADTLIGQWTHHALTWDRSGDIVLYIDGIEVSRDSMTDRIFEDRDQLVHYIGAVGNRQAGRFWDGRIDDLQVYDYALSSGEVFGLIYGLPVAHFPLAENADDIIGTQDGTPQGDILFSRGVASFDGVDDFIVVPDGGTTELATGDFSIAVWSYIPTDTTGYGIFASSGAWSNPGIRYEFGPHDGTYFMAIDDGDTLNNKSECTAVMDPFPYDQWAYVVITRDYGNEVALYVNGVKQASTADITTSIAGPKDTRIGADHDGNFLKGKLSDLKFYDRVLSETEMAGIFAGRLAMISDIDDSSAVDFADIAEMINNWMSDFRWP
jgi:hypothetical protein